MPRPFAVIGFTVFFTIALLFNSGTGAITSILIMFAVALVISLFVTDARKNKVLPCAFASGLIACILLLSELNFYYFPAIDYSGKTCEISAQLTDYPDYRYGNYYYTAKALEINGEAADLKVRLVFSSLPDAEPYDIIEGDFTFYTLGSSSEEYLASYKANGIFVGAYPESGEYSVNVIPESDKPFGKIILDIRKSITNAIYRVLPGDSGSLALALIIGDKSNLSSEIMTDFRLSGITHIICVSGFHLSLCSTFFLSLLKKLHVKDKIASVLTAFAVIFFMLIAGMTYSVVRSGIMMLLFLSSNLMMKRRDSLNSLGFSLVTIAVYNPFAMGSVGLQLSALSTLGLILYSQSVKPKIDSFIRKLDNVYIADILISVFGAVSVSFAATAFTLPVSMKLYNEFNFAVYASNVLAVPIASICILLSVIAAFWGLLFGGDYNFLGLAADIFCRLLLKISQVFADFDLLTFRADSDSSGILICGIFLVCAMSVLMAFYGKNLYKITCALCAVMFTFGLMFLNVSKESETRFNIIDVGNGTAIIASKNGENMLIGCGGTEFLGAEKIIEETEKTGGKLDYIIIPDSDDFSASYIIKTLKSCIPDTIYCESLPYGTELLLTKSEICSIKDHIQTDNFIVRYFSCQEADCVYFESSDMTALICFDPVFDYSLLPEAYKNADIIISRNDYPKNIENNNCKLVVVNSENTRGVIIQNELSDLGVRCVATAGCGNILVRGENGYVSANRYD